MTDTTVWAAEAARELHDLANTIEELNPQPKRGYTKSPEGIPLFLYVATTGDVDKFAKRYGTEIEIDAGNKTLEYMTVIMSNTFRIYVEAKVPIDPTACPDCGYEHACTHTFSKEPNQ